MRIFFGGKIMNGICYTVLLVRNGHKATKMEWNSIPNKTELDSALKNLKAEVA